MNLWFFNLEKKKNGSYLKYEDGKVVPIESKNGYPPFLNDEEGNINYFRSDSSQDTKPVNKNDSKTKEALSLQTDTSLSSDTSHKTLNHHKWLK